MEELGTLLGALLVGGTLLGLLHLSLYGYYMFIEWLGRDER